MEEKKRKKRKKEKWLYPLSLPRYNVYREGKLLSHNWASIYILPEHSRTFLRFSTTQRSIVTWWRLAKVKASRYRTFLRRVLAFYKYTPTSPTVSFSRRNIASRVKHEWLSGPFGCKMSKSHTWCPSDLLRAWITELHLNNNDAYEIIQQAVSRISWWCIRWWRRSTRVPEYKSGGEVSPRISTYFELTFRIMGREKMRRERTMGRLKRSNRFLTEILMRAVVVISAPRHNYKTFSSACMDSGANIRTGIETHGVGRIFLSTI